MHTNLEKLTGHKLEYLDSGAFCKAYRSLDNTSIVFLLTSDNKSKSILSEITNPHIPSMQYVMTIGNDTLWQTSYSESVTKAYTVAHTQMTNLAIKWSSIRNKYSSISIDSWHILARKFIDSLKPNKVYTAELISALESLYSASIDQTTRFKFDMPVENFGVSEDGTLLLRDVVLFR